MIRNFEYILDQDLDGEKTKQIIEETNTLHSTTNKDVGLLFENAFVCCVFVALNLCFPVYIWCKCIRILYLFIAFMRYLILAV